MRVLNECGFCGHSNPKCRAVCEECDKPLFSRGSSPVMESLGINNEVLPPGVSGPGDDSGPSMGGAAANAVISDEELRRREEKLIRKQRGRRF